VMFVGCHVIGRYKSMSERESEWVGSQQTERAVV